MPEFKVGDRVRIKSKDEITDSIFDGFLDWAGGKSGTVKKIENGGMIWVERDDGGVSPGVAREHIPILLEHHSLVPEELFEI